MSAAPSPGSVLRALADLIDSGAADVSAVTLSNDPGVAVRRDAWPVRRAAGDRLDHGHVSRDAPSAPAIGGAG